MVCFGSVWLLVEDGVSPLSSHGATRQAAVHSDAPCFVCALGSFRNE
jgi:hypothetical protein